MPRFSSHLYSARNQAKQPGGTERNVTQTVIISNPSLLYLTFSFASVIQIGKPREKSKLILTSVTVLVPQRNAQVQKRNTGAMSPISPRYVPGVGRGPWFQLTSALRLSRENRIMGAYHLAKKSGNFVLRSNGKAIFRKIFSEIVDNLQR